MISSTSDHSRHISRSIVAAACATVLALAAPLGAQGVPCVAGFAGPYPCHDVDLLAFVPTNTLVGGSSGADMWGWTDPATGREYAVQGLSDAVAFVDVTEPTEPVFVGSLPAPVTNFLWRDVKVFRDHAYVVGDFSPFSTDDSKPDAVHGLQIFDLTRLRGAGPATIFEETARYEGFDEAHNIAINEETGFAYVVASDTCNGGMHILDLEPDPANPTFVGCFENGEFNVHDTQCVVYDGPDAEHQGREICFNANEDVLDIVDVTDKSAPVILSRSVYEGLGYVHQGWLTDDHAHFALSDELDELNAATALDPHNTHTYLWDVRDLDDPVELPTHVGPTAAIDHNLFIDGRFMFQTNYTAGLRILDNAGIATGVLEEIAFFDTHPADDATTFAGSWSSYPFFDSGVVVVSNIEDGLYVLGPHLPADDGDGETADEATGGGWLAATDSGKINFGFKARQTDGGPEGDLQLRDKGADVKIHISDLTVMGSVQGACGSITASETAVEFRGTGTFDGDTAASFRVCAEDRGEPGNSRASDTPDRFFLECLAGCAYSTGARTDDDAIDGGNIQVHRGSEESGDAESEATTLVLSPLLLSEGEIGAIQLFEVRAYGGAEQPVSGEGVTLTRIGADGSSETLTAVTDADGVALFSTTISSQESEYRATTERAESNNVDVSPILP